MHRSRMINNRLNCSYEKTKAGRQMLQDCSLFHGIDPSQCSVTVLGSESVEESAFVVQLKHASLPFNLWHHRETQERKGLTRNPLLRLWICVENFIFQEEPQASPTSLAGPAPLQGSAHHPIRLRLLIERQLSFAASPQTRWMNVLEDRRERSTGALCYCGNISQTNAYTIMRESCITMFN